MLNKKETTKSIIDSYLGFLIIKPIERSLINDPFKKEKLIGRTVLRTYDDEIQKDGHKRHFIKTKNSINLYGLSICLETLPFQTQDIAVGACATTSLWIINHIYNEMFDIKRASLFEITLKSNKYTENYRNFPSYGLTLKQVLTFLKEIGLDYEIINIQSLLKNEADEYLKEIVPVLLQAYIKNANIPIISFVKDMGPEFEYDKNCKTNLPKNNNNSEENEWASEHIYHTAVISGLRTDKYGSINEIYVHDDGMGPYTRIKSKDDNNSYIHWKRNFTNSSEIYELMYLVVPIYPKIRLTFDKIYDYFIQFQTDFNNIRQKNINIKDSKWSFFLTTVQDYKKHLLSNLTKEEHLKILYKPMPRFLWIFRFEYKNELIKDVIFDGTSVEIAQITDINYI